MIKCAIFDADGTLLDSMPMWRDITYEYADFKGCRVPDGLHETLNRLSLEQCAEHYISLGVSGTRDQVVDELSAWALKGYRTRVNEKPGAGEFLKLLRQSGVKVAVATASQEKGVQAALERLGMLPCVDFLTTCTQVGKSKEHPDIFLRCAAAFGATPEEAVVFEDSAYALRTAKLAGFSTVAVEDPISMADSGDLASIRRWADRRISDYHQLIGELSSPEDRP